MLEHQGLTGTRPPEVRDKMKVLSPSKQGFETFLRVAKSSVAEPPWFAAVVDTTEDDDSLTIVFHVPHGKGREVRIEAKDERLHLSEVGRGTGARARRICALPFPVSGQKIDTTHLGDWLKVRIPKTRQSVSPKVPPPAGE